MRILTIPVYNEENNLGGIIKAIKNTRYNLLDRDKSSKDKKAKGSIEYSNSENIRHAETLKTKIKRYLKLKSNIIIHTDTNCQYLKNSFQN